MPTLRIVLSTLLAFLIGLSGAVMARESPAATPIEVEGFPLSLSPDGALLAGMGADGHQFCVWEVTTREPRCDGDIPDLVEVRSIAWSPDSTAVAFSLGVLNRLVDSDLYLFDAVSGTLGNLTEDDPEDTGADNIPFFGPQPAPVTIDYFPAWSPDGETLAFARTIWGDDTSAPVTLMTIPRDGGEPAGLVALPEATALSLVGSMWWLEDDTIVFSTRHPDPQDEMNAVWTLSGDGELTRVLDGTGAAGIIQPAVAGISPDGRTASVYSRVNLLENLGRPEAPIFFQLDLGTGTLSRWQDIHGVTLPEGASLMAAPVSSPQGDATAFLIRDPAGRMSISILDGSGNMREIGTVSYRTGSRPPLGTGIVSPALHWASDDSLLVVLTTGGSLIRIPPGTASPVASPIT